MKKCGDYWNMQKVEMYGLNMQVTSFRKVLILEGGEAVWQNSNVWK